MADGLGCKCGAYGAYECSCEGVDWRTAREIELEAACDRYKEALENIALKNHTKPQIKSIARKVLYPEQYTDKNFS